MSLKAAVLKKISVFTIYIYINDVMHAVPLVATSHVKNS